MENLELKALKGLSVPILLAILAPMGVIVVLSFCGGDTLIFPPQDWSLRWYETVLTSDEWTGPILNSLRVATAATIISTIVYIPAGIVLGLRQRMQWLLVIFVLPFVVPPLVLAIGLYEGLGALRSTFWALPLSHAIFASPVVVLVLRNAAQTIEAEGIRAAQVHGATFFQAVRGIVIPRIAPSIAASALIPFLLSLNEPILSLYLSTPWNQTLPMKVWSSLRFNVSPATAAVGSISMLFSGLLLGVILGLISKNR